MSNNIIIIIAFIIIFIVICGRISLKYFLEDFRALLTVRFFLVINGSAFLFVFAFVETCSRSLHGDSNIYYYYYYYYQLRAVYVLEFWDSTEGSDRVQDLYDGSLPIRRSDGWARRCGSRHRVMRTESSITIYKKRNGGYSGRRWWKK